jgi:hypothetical protein
VDDEVLRALQERAIAFLGNGAVEAAISEEGHEEGEPSSAGSLPLSASEVGCVVALLGAERRRREQQAHANSGVPRDELGRMVRGVWVNWAHEQPDVAEHPNWTRPYDGPDGISERDREVDRRIGETLFAAARLGYQRASDARDYVASVYRDRNLALVLAASVLGSLGIPVAMAEDPSPKGGWRQLLAIDLKVGVVTWKIHDNDLAMFSRVARTRQVVDLPTRQAMAERIFQAIDDFEAMARTARAGKAIGGP